ncbi:hypothetical protein B484DRAFT_389322, partial [Ochromonadaceae sp. CCMP2298]
MSTTNSAKYPNPSLDIRPLSSMLSDTTDSLPLSTSRSSAPAVDMFALTYQAPAQGRLENIQPDFATTNLLPTSPLARPPKSPGTKANNDSAPTTSTLSTTSTSTSDTSSSGGTSITTAPVATHTAKGGSTPSADKPAKDPTAPTGQGTATSGTAAGAPAASRTDSGPRSDHHDPTSGLGGNPDSGSRPMRTRQQLLRTSGQDLLYSPHPRTSTGFNAALGLKVWFNVAPEDGADVLVVIPLAGAPALPSDAQRPIPMEQDAGDTASTDGQQKRRRRQRSPSHSSASEDTETRRRHRRARRAGGGGDIPLHRGNRDANAARETSRARESRRTHDGSSSDSEGTHSDAGNDATTTFRDAAHRSIKRVKGFTMQVIRSSEPLRAFATPARVDALLATV